MAKISLTPELLLEQKDKMLQLREAQSQITSHLNDAVNTMNEGLTSNLRHNVHRKTQTVLNNSKSFENLLSWGANAIQNAVTKYQKVQRDIMKWINDAIGAIFPWINSGNSGSSSNTGVVVVNENSSIPNTQWSEITPHKTNAEGQRSASAYNEVLADLDVENRGRYQPKNGNTWCNIYVWDATKAMGCEIPHYYDPKTGAGLSRDYCLKNPGSYLEMSANRMTKWLENYGSQNGWIECDQETAIKMANNGMPTVVAATTTGHVGMVVPQNEGETGVMISQAGASNFNHGPQSQGFGNYPVKYFYHA